MEKTKKKQLKKDLSVLEKQLMRFKVDKVSQNEMNNMKEAMDALERSMKESGMQ